jgi:hypothetical protein
MARIGPENAFILRSLALRCSYPAVEQNALCFVMETASMKNHNLVNCPPYEHRLNHRLKKPKYTQPYKPLTTEIRSIYRSE